MFLEIEILTAAKAARPWFQTLERLRNFMKDLLILILQEHNVKLGNQTNMESGHVCGLVHLPSTPGLDG